MKNRFSLTIVAVLGLTVMASVSQATPMLGTVGTANNYSLIHPGATPSGEAGPWSWFEPGQQLSLIMADGFLTLDGAQSLQLMDSEELPIGSVTFEDMSLDLNDIEDGFAGGWIEYTLGETWGVFKFADLTYSRYFNSSSWDGDVLNVYLWGGDPENNLGMDLKLSIERAAVPEPGIVALLLLGLAGMTLVRTRREQPRARI
ncbi:MAG: PEP-CTERM sorting domain-containing protein [Gammaproteobacteria bacterium]|nr:PEP-CTERM sorting domain-containing protein [Gammaproteobacteria bacterium]